MDDLKELLNQIDMELYLDREGIEYKLTRGSSGQQLNLRTCPVCGGNGWKVYLNADTGLGNCFSGSCESKFNKFSFIRAYMPGVSGREVVRHIKHVASEQGWRQKRKVGFAVDENTDLKLPDSVELPLDGKNLKYLTDRGIGQETTKYFRLRYSKSGHFSYRQDGQGRRQDYSNRIIIPIYDLEGTLVSFQGRDITGQAERKYLFPPGYASTGKYLYNGHNAIGARRIVICEGVFDVMAAQTALEEDVSLRDVVAIGTFGKHLSHGFDNDQVSQLLKLKAKGLRECTFMWDAEQAALKAAVHAALIVSRMGIKSRVAILPKGCDPNEATTHEVIGAYKFSHAINKIEAIKLLSKLTHF